jgi:MFS family permease
MNYQPPAQGFRTFVILWFTQSLSVIGTGITLFATTIWLTQVQYPSESQQPQLAFALAAVALAYGIPVVFAAPIAGAWADRHDRRLTMIGANLVSGSISVCLVVLLLTGTLQIWILLAILVLYSISGSFHFASFDSSYAMLVPEAQLPRANGMMHTTYALSAMLGPGIAAALISLPKLLPGLLPAALDNHGTALAFGADGLTFLTVAIVLLFLAVPSPVRDDLQSGPGAKKKSMWSDIGIGAQYILQRRPLLWLLGTFTLTNLIYAPFAVLQPLIVKIHLFPPVQSLGFTFETALALTTTTLGLGGVVGGFIVSFWGGLKTRRIYGVLIPLGCAALTLVGFGLTRSLFVAAGMALIRGLASPMIDAHSQAIWQTQTPRELQGRVFSFRRLIAQCTYPLGTLLAGVFGGFGDPSVTVAVLGGILAVFCFAQLFNPLMLRIEDKEWLDTLAASRNVAERAK